LVNSSMILGGMGPVDPIKSTGGKLFASFYALFSGVIFLATAGILFGPIVHRLLHQLHLDAGERDDGVPEGPGDEVFQLAGLLTPAGLAASSGTRPLTNSDPTAEI